MAEFDLVATGGTFDIIHKGHKRLLSKAFSISSHVIIGLTSDDFAKQMGKTPIHKYGDRLDALNAFIRESFAGSSFLISKLDCDFGPAVLEKDVQALVASEETQAQGVLLNKMRAAKNLPPVRIISVPMVLAKDGMPISTTRIKSSQIDSDGNLQLP